MTSGGLCVMTPGTTLMLLWSASSWDMHILEVRLFFYVSVNIFFNLYMYTVCTYMQVAGHIAMPTLVLAVDQSFWMMYSVPQVPANYWNAIVDQF